MGLRTIRISSEHHKAIKLHAAKNDTKIKDIIEMMIINFLETENKNNNENGHDEAAA